MLHQAKAYAVEILGSQGLLCSLASGRSEDLQHQQTLKSVIQAELSLINLERKELLTCILIRICHAIFLNILFCARAHFGIATSDVDSLIHSSVPVCLFHVYISYRIRHNSQSYVMLYVFNHSSKC